MSLMCKFYTPRNKNSLMYCENCSPNENDFHDKKDCTSQAPECLFHVLVEGELCLENEDCQLAINIFIFDTESSSLPAVKCLDNPVSHLINDYIRVVSEHAEFLSGAFSLTVRPLSCQRREDGPFRVVTGDSTVRYRVNGGYPVPKHPTPHAQPLTLCGIVYI